MVCLHIRNTEANVIKRLYPIAFIFLLAAPLLLAQDSQSNNSQPANIGGDWQISWQARNGQQATIQIQQDGSNLSGTFQDANGSSSVTGSIAGNNVSFSVQIQGRPMSLAFTGTIDGNKMSGTFQPQGGGGSRGGRGGGQGSHTWSGVRQQGN
jgi:OAA-family lectin sugar binding domain